MVCKALRSRSPGTRLSLRAAFIVSLISNPVSAGVFEAYGPASTFTLPEGAHGLTVLRDGRLLTLVGSDVYLETAVGSRTYARQGALPAADFSDFGPAFLRVSPDGTKLAVGNSGGASFSNQQVGVFDVGTLNGRWFKVNHFDAAWIDNTQLALTGGAFGSASFASVLDTTSTDTMNPSNTVVVNHIGGASGGIAFDAAGNLYTGNGFALSGPSATGAVKFFDAGSWMAALAGGTPVDFEADGSLVAEVLSAAPLRFDAEGNLIVGGGDFDGGDVGYAALVHATALSDAIAGLGAADIFDPNEVRRFDPDPIDTFNFYSVDFNDVTEELYVRDGATVYAFAVPEPATLLLIGVVVLALLGHRAVGFRPYPHAQAGLPMRGSGLRHRPLLAPSGQLRIAQRFDAGIGGDPDVHSPVGTIDRPSAVPTELVGQGTEALPASKRWAIVRRPYGTIKRDVVEAAGFIPRETLGHEDTGGAKVRRVRDHSGGAGLRQVRTNSGGASVRPAGALDCSHGWSPAQPGATRGVGARILGPSGTAFQSPPLSRTRIRPTATILFLSCVLANVCYGASPFAVDWLEYDPAPGLWVCDPQFNNPNNALDEPIGGGTADANLDSLVSLGGYGGSITLGFDHTVTDDPLNPFGLDAIVFGNAIWQWDDFFIPDPNRHWAECGTIEIARDANGDGIANDPWYLIPGSHIPDPQSQFSEQTWDDDTGDPTYPPTDPLCIPTARSGEWQTKGYLLPGDVFAQTVVVNPAADEGREGIYGYADYTPTLVLGDLDADDVVDDPDVTPEAFYTVPDDPFAIGISAGSGGGDAFDIAWAINPATGEPAGLSGFDFIRITTGVNFIHGVFGEFSPEIDAVADVAPDPFGDFDGDGDIDLADAAGFVACFHSGNASGPKCARLDRVSNGDINLVDFSAFAKRMTGPIS